MKNQNQTPRAAFVGFGEINTPKELIVKKCQRAREKLQQAGVDLVYVEPVQDDPDGKDVQRAKNQLSEEKFDVLLVVIAGWIPSHAVIAAVDSFKHKPMVLLGLTGWKEGDRFVTTADQAGTTALWSTFQAMGYKAKYVVTKYGQDIPIDKVISFVHAGVAAQKLRGARIGMLGNRDMNLYSTLYDGMSLRSVIGPEIEFFDLFEMQQKMKGFSSQVIDDYIEKISARWSFTHEPQKVTLDNTVRLFLAVKDKVEERGYDAISLIDVDGVKKHLKFAPAGVFMLLQEELDISTIPENDSLGAVTQLLTRYLVNQTGAYLEFYEFLEDGMLMGVPDYVPTEIVDGKVRVMPTSFGEFGEGLLNISKVRTGQLTLARLAFTGQEYVLHMTQGIARTPRSWEEAGWKPPAPQLPGVEIKIDTDVDEFIQKVKGQHYIISYGKNKQLFNDLCFILNVRVI